MLRGITRRRNTLHQHIMRILRRRRSWSFQYRRRDAKGIPKLANSSQRDKIKANRNDIRNRQEACRCQQRPNRNGIQRCQSYDDMDETTIQRPRIRKDARFRTPEALSKRIFPSRRSETNKERQTTPVLHTMGSVWKRAKRNKNGLGVDAQHL